MRASAGIRAVALPVDARTVHRDEQTGVGILVGDRRDPGAVEGEVRGDVDVEEGDRLALAVDHRRALPGRPAVVVAPCGKDDGVVTRASIGPGARDLLRELGVLGLEHDLPGGPRVANDHDAASIPASTSAVGHDVTVLRVDVVEVRLVGVAVAIADGIPRDQHAVAVLQRVDRRRSDAPGGRGTRDDERVARVRGEEARERRPVEGRRPELREHGLVALRCDARVDLRPTAARFENEQRGNLRDERLRGLLARLVVRNGGEGDGQPCRPETVEQQADRVHDAVEVADER